MSRSGIHPHLAPLLAMALVGACVTTEKTTAPSPDPRGGAGASDASPADDKNVAPGPRKLAPGKSGHRLVTQLEKHHPIFNVRALFLAGSRDDPPGKEGLTALSAALMAEATRDLSAEALQEKLFPWSAELGVHTDKETTVFVGRVHRDHAAGFSRVMADLLTAPRLDPRDFARIKEKHINHLVRTLRQNADEFLQREALESALYDAHPPMVKVEAKATDKKKAQKEAKVGLGPLRVRHPYRHTPTGTESGLKSITLEDVKAHIQKVFTQDRLILGLGGGVDPKTADAFKASMAVLPPKGAPRPSLPAPTSPLKNKAIFVDKAAAGTAISLGFHLAVDRTHPDYAALKLAESYFGEHRNAVGVLFNQMRQKRGLNYGDYAYVEHFVQAGWSTMEKLNVGRKQQYFSIWIRPVEHKNRHFALRQAVFELQRFVERGIPDDETFKRMQAFVDGYWRSKEQTAMRRLGYALDDAFYGGALNRDALRKAVAGLTREQVNAAIRKHLRADRLTFVVVTEGAEEFAADVAANKKSPIVYPARVDAAVRKEDEGIVVLDLGLSRSDIRVIKPEALFAQ
jgi:zinc protease